MNFIEEYKKGQAGGNKGLPLGKGLEHISNAINGLQRGRLFGIAGSPKSGKTTITDYAFLIQPYLYAVENNIPIEFIYYSFEIDRVSKEFDIATYFLYKDYGITHVKLEECTKEGASEIELSPDYLRGRILDDKNEIIKVKNSIYEVLKKIYTDRILPLFGEYGKTGKQIKAGVMTFIENRDNPTGIYKQLMEHARQHGKFLYNNETKFKRIIGYEPKNNEKYTIVIVDHIRKLILERGWQMKQNVDKFLEYEVELC